MGFSIKIVTNKLIHLNKKQFKSEKEEKEYELMLKNKDLNHEQLSYLLDNHGIIETKKLFTTQTEIPDNSKSLAIAVFFVAVLLIIWFSDKKKEKQEQNN